MFRVQTWDSVTWYYLKWRPFRVWVRAAEDWTVSNCNHNNHMISSSFYLNSRHGFSFMMQQLKSLNIFLRREAFLGFMVR